MTKKSKPKKPKNPKNNDVVDQAMRQKTRRSFLVGGVAAVLGSSAWAWMTSRAELLGIPWPFRRALEAEESLWRALFRPNHLQPEPKPVRNQEPRLNGDIGLEDEIDLHGWRLRVIGAKPGENHVLTMNDLKTLPRTEVTADFKCIEGWSETMSFGGVRFADFMQHLGISHTRYVGLETPDRKYYVSIDMESMLHPQTLLSDQMNGRALSQDHGAPLRLFIPVKYGIKHLKRVATIRFSDERLPDYWAEQGYDWYSGL